MIYPSNHRFDQCPFVIILPTCGQRRIFMCVHNKHYFLLVWVVYRVILFNRKFFAFFEIFASSVLKNPFKIMIITKEEESQIYVPIVLVYVVVKLHLLK